jgi:non-heme chloroperoxidase
MSTIEGNDGVAIYYKDWGKGPVVRFSHGWPLNDDAGDGRTPFLVQKGLRVVAYDRRGHGRSGQTSSGNDVNGYADDLAAVTETLDPTEATLVGHSTGARWRAISDVTGPKRFAGAVLVAAVPESCSSPRPVRKAFLNGRTVMGGPLTPVLPVTKPSVIEEQLPGCIEKKE